MALFPVYAAFFADARADVLKVFLQCFSECAVVAYGARLVRMRDAARAPIPRGSLLTTDDFARLFRIGSDATRPHSAPTSSDSSASVSIGRAQAVLRVASEAALSHVGALLRDSVGELSLTLSGDAGDAAIAQVRGIAAERLVALVLDHCLVSARGMRDLEHFPRLAMLTIRGSSPNLSPYELTEALRALPQVETVIISAPDADL